METINRSDILRSTVNTENQNETVLRNRRGFYFLYIQIQNPEKFAKLFPLT